MSTNPSPVIPGHTPLVVIWDDNEVPTGPFVAAPAKDLHCFYCIDCDAVGHVADATQLPAGWGMVYRPDDWAVPAGSLGPFYACATCLAQDSTPI